MNVGGRPLHFPAAQTTMELSQSFPPADALLAHLRSIDYKKHLNNYMDFVENACIIIAAIVYVIYKKFSEWYSEGGKDATVQLIQTVWNFLQLCYVWVRTKGYPKFVKMLDNVKQTYRDWQDLVTV